MKENGYSPSRPGIAPVFIFVLVFVAVLFTVGVVTTAVTFILPQGFTCTAGISTKPDPVSDPAHAVPGPDFIAAACQIIRSPAVLTPVIERLDLNDVWGRKQPYGGTLKTSESLEILKQRLQVSSVRETNVIAITVYSDDKLEASQIANVIAGSYQEYRQQNYAGPKSSPAPVLVQIVGIAEPNLAVPKPNKPLNITLGGVVGAVLGLPLGGVAAFIASRIRDRRLRQH